MATKEERSSFLCKSLPLLVPFAIESHCKHVGADSLEMDTRKEKGQRSAESKLSLTSHSSSVNTAFPFFSTPLFLFVLSDLCAWPNLFQLYWYIHYCTREPGQVEGGLGKSWKQKDSSWIIKEVDTLPCWKRHKSVLSRGRHEHHRQTTSAL